MAAEEIKELCEAHHIEHIIVENGSYGGENPPIPDSNLRGDKPLLDYMLKKWGAISTTKVN
jgi:hypothetical protein